MISVIHLTNLDHEANPDHQGQDAETSYHDAHKFSSYTTTGRLVALREYSNNHSLLQTISVMLSKFCAGNCFGSSIYTKCTTLVRHEKQTNKKRCKT